MPWLNLALSLCDCVCNDPQCGNFPAISQSCLESLFRTNVCLGLPKAERETVKEKRGRETGSEPEKESV